MKCDATPFRRYHTESTGPTVERVTLLKQKLIFYSSMFVFPIVRLINIFLAILLKFTFSHSPCIINLSVACGGSRTYLKCHVSWTFQKK